MPWLRFQHSIWTEIQAGIKILEFKHFFIAQNEIEQRPSKYGQIRECAPEKRQSLLLQFVFWSACALNSVEVDKHVCGPMMDFYNSFPFFINHQTTITHSVNASRAPIEISIAACGSLYWQCYVTTTTTMSSVWWVVSHVMYVWWATEWKILLISLGCIWLIWNLYSQRDVVHFEANTLHKNRSSSVMSFIQNSRKAGELVAMAEKEKDEKIMAILPVLQSCCCRWWRREHQAKWKMDDGTRARNPSWFLSVLSSFAYSFRCFSVCLKKNNTQQ